MDNELIARIAALHYVSDATPGISRKRYGKKFIYYYSDGSRVTDSDTLIRIQKLVIPPAYHDVWISPLANSHIQATGRDSKNRKQYRYHAKWREIREENKFMSMIFFGKALPKIRKHIEVELNSLFKMNKTQIICVIIYLLDNHFIRIGNAIYERQNKSYGLTTLRKKHLTLNTRQAVLNFVGKNAKPWHVILKDKKIISILKKCDSISGYRLFKYLDEEDGHYYEINSQDINNYLHDLTDYSFTAKDFRTWGACRETLYRLVQIPYENEAQAQKDLNNVIDEVASLLGHTPAICKKSYIYPEIIAQWKSTQLNAWIKKYKRYIDDKDKLLLQWLKNTCKE
jgi:DNA topoisomerase-1